MKKTTSITIGGRRFYLEEEGYGILHSYLESLRAYFAAHRDFDDIIADIESRIAERFAELQASANAPAISTHNVAELIDTIGKPTDIGEGNDANDPVSGTYPRRLFRDVDNGLLAGVSAGLGSYLKVDPNVVRVAFALLALLYGIGIWVYVVFWLVIPAARTSTDRLSMHGAPVTLASLVSLFSLRKRDTTERDALGKMIATPFTAAKRGATAVSGVTQSIVGVLFPLMKRIAAFAFVIGGALMILLVCVGVTLALSRVPEAYFDPMIAEFLDQAPRRTLALAGGLSLLIPAALILAVGTSMLRKRNLLQPTVGFGMIAVWFVAIIITSVVGVRTAMGWQSFRVTNPAFHQASVSFTPPTLTSLDATGTNTTVRLVEGLVPTVTLEGRQKDIDRLVHTVENGAVRIARKPDARPCVECDVRQVRVTVAAPATDSIIFLSPVQRPQERRSGALPLAWAIPLPVSVRRAYDASVEAVRDFGFTVIDSSAVNGRFRTRARAAVPAPGDPSVPLLFPDSVLIEVTVRSESPTASRLSLNVITPTRHAAPESRAVRAATGQLATMVSQRIHEYVGRPR